MSRADGRLLELLADEVCRAILRCLLGSEEPLTQRALTSSLALGSSTISRRMRELEDAGLVARASGHAPYRVLFPEKTRELLRAGADLAFMAHDGLAKDVQNTARELRKEEMAVQLPVFRTGDSA